MATSNNPEAAKALEELCEARKANDEPLVYRDVNKQHFAFVVGGELSAHFAEVFAGIIALASAVSARTSSDLLHKLERMMGEEKERR